jgi:hypothetical protein
MTVERRSWVFAASYMSLSLVVEVVLIAIVGLRVPKDNAIIAPILLTIAPVLAALSAGYRRPKEFFLLIILTVALTLLIVLVFGRATGISTGLFAPIVIRSLAGFLAATITNRVVPKTRTMGNECQRTVKRDQAGSK